MGGAATESAVDLREVREKQAITRSGFLRGHGGYLTAAAFRERRAYFAAKVRPICRTKPAPPLLSAPIHSFKP